MAMNNNDNSEYLARNNNALKLYLKLTGHEELYGKISRVCGDMTPDKIQSTFSGLHAYETIDSIQFNDTKEETPNLRFIKGINKLTNILKISLKREAFKGANDSSTLR